MTNSKQHIYALARMASYSEIEHFIFIDWSRDSTHFCTRLLNRSVPICRSLTENSYNYAVQWYGNTQFTLPDPELMQVLSEALLPCAAV